MTARGFKFIAIGAVIVVGMFYLSSFVSVDFLGHCTYEDLGKAESFNSDYVAEITQLSCQDDPTLTQILLKNKETGVGRLVFESTLYTTLPIQMTWEKSGLLSISYPAAYEPTNLKDRYEYIRIKFKEY